MKVSAVTKSGQKIFIIIMFLFLFSFFDESEISWLSFSALIATSLIPIVILFSFVTQNRKINKGDKLIIAFFAVLMVIQFIGIRWNDLYTSLTPIYRSFTVLMVVLYFRRFALTEQIVRYLLFLSFIVILLGFATIFTPARENTNLFFGNYNTVGVLYFTLTIVNFIVYLKTKKITALLLAFLDLALILISNTRTALFLLIITFLLYFFAKLLSSKILKPKIFFSVTLIFLALFIYLYYNIRSLSIYSFMNELSQKLFHKNFDSGRPELWGLTVEVVGNNWLFGQGTGIDLEFFIPTLKTPHSVFFDLYLQNGLLGVISYILCILVTLKGKNNFQKNNVAIFIMIIAFVFIFYNSVGIVFTKARSGIGLIQWGLMSLPYVSKEVKFSVRREQVDKSYSACIQRKTIY